MAKLTKISSIVSSDLISSDKFRVEIIFVAVFYKINMDVSVVKIKLGTFKIRLQMESRILPAAIKFQVFTCSKVLAQA